MKRIVCVCGIVLQILLPCGCSKESAKDSVTSVGTEPVKQGNYKNGVYEGKTPIDYEGYNALAKIEVANGYLSLVDWDIYDNNLKRYFDGTYEEVYTGNPLYIQQCRDNMKGMVAYGPNLIQTQNIKSVEAITGATWCYNKFKEVVKITLKNAYADSANAADGGESE
jgi:major membrane immunogen (membrane-anchored lipoprotein)